MDISQAYQQWHLPGFQLLILVENSSRLTVFLFLNETTFHTFLQNISEALNYMQRYLQNPMKNLSVSEGYNFNYVFQII